jgi:glucokinase
MLMTVTPYTMQHHESSHEHAAVAIGLDVGGTKIAGGVVTADGRIVDHALMPTPASTDEAATLAAITHMIEEFRTKHPRVEAIGVGAAGLVEWPAGRIRFAPNNAYRNLPLRARLQEATGLPTVVDNDANVAAWAEARFGAELACEHMVLLTIGTGIGGGLLLGGEIFRGSGGLGGEVGHMIVDPHGEQCACGNVGCLEAMASGTALGRLGRKAAVADPKGRLAELAGIPEQVNGRIVFQAAREGDRTARALFDQIGFWLGMGIASLVTIFDPELVVLSGGLITAGDLLLTPARVSFQRFVFAAQHRELPPLIFARLGLETGLVGAATLALHYQH